MISDRAGSAVGDHHVTASLCGSLRARVALVGFVVACCTACLAAGRSASTAPARSASASAPVPATTTPWATLHVDGRLLRDPCGEVVVLRGVNHPTLYVDRSGRALPEIATTGANAVRLFWAATHGVPIVEAEPAIAAAVDVGLWPMLEMHDSTSTWQLAPIVDYWTSPEAVALIARHERHLLVNLANEASVPFSGQQGDDVFEADVIDAIVRLRSAGIRVPIVIDGTSSGRNHQVLFARGPAIIAGDPLHNVLFSVHWYDDDAHGGGASDVSRVLQDSVARGLPLIVGEFANRSLPRGAPPTCGPLIPWQHLIGEAERLQVGWLAWSWGDDDEDTVWNTDCADFDMTRTFAASTLSGWARAVAIDDVASIKNTSRRSAFLRTGACAP